MGLGRLIGFGKGALVGAVLAMGALPARAAVIDYDGIVFNKHVNGASFSLVHNGATGSGSPILWNFDPDQPFAFTVDTGADNVFNAGDTVTTTGVQTLNLTSAGGSATPAKIELSGLSLTANNVPFAAASGLADGFGNSLSGKSLLEVAGTLDFSIKNGDGTTTFLSGTFQFDAMHVASIFNGAILDTVGPKSIFSAFLWGGAGGQMGILDNSNQTSIFDILNSGSTDPITGLGIDVAFSADPVPEPATLALFGSGLIGLGFARRRRRHA